MTTLRKEHRNKKLRTFVLTAKIQGKLSRPWGTMKEPELFERAQRAVDQTGLADPKSFDEVFRGISFELTRRGFSPDYLDFSFGKPTKQLKPAVSSKTIQVVEPANTCEAKPESSIPSKPWPELTDEEFTSRSKEIIHRRGITDWETFKKKCKGILQQLFDRHLPREELGFSN